MLKDKKIGIIGTGNMGEALVSGLISSQSAPPDHIICTDVSESKLAAIQEKYAVRITSNNIEAIRASSIIIFAVKPQILASVLKETADALDIHKTTLFRKMKKLCITPPDRSGPTGR